MNKTTAASDFQLKSGNDERIFIGKFGGGSRKTVLILRSKNPMCSLAAVIGKQDGLKMGILLDGKKSPLHEMAKVVARTADLEDLPWFASCVSEDLMRWILTETRGKPGASSGFEGDQLDFLRQNVRSNLPEASLKWLSEAQIHGDQLEGWVSFFMQGDKEARAQAVWSMPLLSYFLPSNEGLLNAVDSRKEVKGWVAALVADFLYGDDYGPYRKISGSQQILEGEKEGQLAYSVTQRLMHLQAIAKNALEAENLSFSDISLSPDSIKKMLLSLTAVRKDQIPETWADASLMNVVISKTFSTSMVIGISPHPYLRKISQTSKDEWGEFKNKVRGFEAKMTLVRDYLDAISGQAVSALLIREMRSEIPDHIYSDISKLCERIWSKEAVAPEESAFLKPFLKFTSGKWSNRVADDFLTGAATGFRMAMSRQMSLKQLSELQERWHMTQAQIEAKAMQDTGDLSWEPLIGTVDLGNGQRAVELNSGKSLSMNGKIMEHCVGGHAPKILASNDSLLRVVFAIEDHEGKCLSTIELRGNLDETMEGETFNWSIKEHKAKRNTSPCDDAHEGAGRLLSIVKKMPPEDCMAYCELLQSNPASLVGHLQKAIANFRCNPSNPEIPEILEEAIHDVLPKSWRGLDRIEASLPDKDIETMKRLASGIAQEMIDAHSELTLKTAADAGPSIEG